MRHTHRRSVWMLTAFLSAMAISNKTTIVEAADISTNEGEYLICRVEADVLNVRAGQGTDHDILIQIYQDEQYEVTGEAVNHWYPLKIGEIYGWVYGDYIHIEENASAAEAAIDKEGNVSAAEATVIEENASAGGWPGQAVVDFACQFIGNPYVWGGTSLTEGADCSGFVQSVYANFGIALPRTTYDMEEVGMPVTYEQALPGDLVLYDGHVGLYMGDGRIVNAMNEEDGIGICSATYAPILTIRRVLSTKVLSS